ncbi:MAG: PH domain-containing protein [Candidatus Sigynarchaeota archaeon]
MQPDEARSFRPAPSKGGCWSVALGIVIVGTLSAVFIPVVLMTSDMILTSFSFVLVGGISALFSVVIHGYFKMAYIVSRDLLVLRWGFFKMVIPLNEIASVGRPSSTAFDGIRTAGVGIPDHLYGAFRLLIDGSYRPIKLVATRMANLVIIVTSAGKYYGITPAAPEEFIATVKQRIGSIAEKQFDNTQRLAGPESMARKHQVLTTALFVAVLIEAGISITYMVVVFPWLPEIVPLHYDLGGTPDRFGNKGELALASLVPLAISIGLAVLFYAATRWRSQLQKSVYGMVLMLLPLAVGTIFLVLNISLIAPLIP